MWRYYAVATLIVIVLGSLALARRWTEQHPAAPREHARAARGAPAAPGNGIGPPQPVTTFGGDGPWVMSALPDCFDQQKATIGPTRLVQHDIPPAGARLAPGAVVHWNGCVAVVGPHDVRIARGTDRLRVPPEARLYARDGRLTLVWQSPYGRTEIRVYARSRPQ